MLDIIEKTKLIKEANRKLKSLRGKWYIKDEGPNTLLLKWNSPNFIREIEDFKDLTLLTKELIDKIKEAELNQKRKYKILVLEDEEFFQSPYRKYLHNSNASYILNRASNYLRKEKKPIKYIVWDTETEYLISKENVEYIKEERLEELEAANYIKDSTVIRPFLLCYKDLDTNKVYNCDKRTGFRPFLEYIHKATKSHTVILVAHNAIYDIKAMTPVLEEHPDLYHKYYVHCRERDSMILAYIEFKDGAKVWLNDTYLFYNSSLEEAAGVKKASVPYGICNLEIDGDTMRYWSFSAHVLREYPWKQYLEYCLKDIELLELIHKKKLALIKAVTDLVGIPLDITYKFNLTQSGLSKFYISKVLERDTGWVTLYRDLYRWKVPKEEYEIMHNSKIGGLTATCKLPVVNCTEDEAIYKLDICSEYPYIMVNGLPKGRWEDKPLGRWKGYIRWVWIELVEYPQLKEKYKNTNFDSLIKSKYKLHIKKGQKVELILLERYFTHLSELFENFDQCFRCKCFKYQEIGYEFKKPYIELYELKKDCDRLLEETENSERIKELKARRSIIKIILNGGYGKLMQKSYDVTDIFDGTEKYSFENDIEYENNLTGVYIATVGRCLLLEAFFKCVEAGYSFLYCDTDSLTIKGPNNEARIREIFGELDTKELGSWGLEGVYTEAYFWEVKKKYMLLPSNGLEEALKRKYIDKSFAFAGIVGLVELMKDLYLHNYERFREMVRILHEGNPLFIANKNKSVKTERYKQSIIAKISVIFNTKKGDYTDRLRIVSKEGKYDFIKLD